MVGGLQCNSQTAGHTAPHPALPHVPQHALLLLEGRHALDQHVAHLRHRGGQEAEGGLRRKPVGRTSAEAWPPHGPQPRACSICSMRADAALISSTAAVSSPLTALSCAWLTSLRLCSERSRGSASAQARDSFPCTPARPLEPTPAPAPTLAASLPSWSARRRSAALTFCALSWRSSCAATRPCSVACVRSSLDDSSSRRA